MGVKDRAQLERWCREGDQAAFRAFYRAQAPRLWRFLVARGVEREDAYDLVAEAFARFLKVVCRDPASPAALLFRIALNLNLDRLRRTATRAELARALAARPPEAPDEPEDGRALRRAVGALGETEQNLLLMRYWLGMTHKEIAAALALPEGTVRRRAAEALAALRAILGEEAAG